MSSPGAGFPTSVWDGSSASRDTDFSKDKSPDYHDFDKTRDELIAAQTLLRALSLGDAVAASSQVVGGACYIKSDGTIEKARANAASTIPAVGLLIAAVGSAATGTYKKRGPLTLTTAEWDIVTGGSGGLTPGAQYFISDATAGHITSTAPVTNTNYVQAIGVALTATTMDVNPDRAGLIPY